MPKFWLTIAALLAVAGLLAVQASNPGGWLFGLASAMALVVSIRHRRHT